MISLRAARSSVAHMGMRIAVFPMTPSVVGDAVVVAGASGSFIYRSAAISAAGKVLRFWTGTAPRSQWRVQR